MTTYVDMIEDSRGDLVEIHWFCCAHCFREYTGRDPYGFAWLTGPDESDSDTYCHNCETLMREGLSQDD